MQAIASRRLRDLCEESLRISAHHTGETAIALYLLAEHLSAHSKVFTSYLCESLYRAAVRVEYQGHADQAFVPDGANFNRIAIVHTDDERRNGRQRKKRVRNRLIGVK